MRVHTPTEPVVRPSPKPTIPDRTPHFPGR